MNEVAVFLEFDLDDEHEEYDPSDRAAWWNKPVQLQGKRYARKYNVRTSRYLL